MNCYVDSFRLSEAALISKYHDNYGDPYKSETRLNFKHHNLNVLQWAIFSEAFNPMILKLLSNIVEVVKREYLRESVIINNFKGYHLVMCITSKVTDN
jgi:hypothetical protein